MLQSEAAFDQSSQNDLLALNEMDIQYKYFESCAKRTKEFLTSTVFALV